MVGAAPTKACLIEDAASPSTKSARSCRAGAIICATLLLSAGLAGIANAAHGKAAGRVSSAEKSIPTLADLWGIQIAPGRNGSFDRKALLKLHGYGVNALLLNIQSLGPSAGAIRTFEEVLSFAVNQKMLLVAVVPYRQPAAPVLDHALAGCRHGRAALRCALQAPSLASAEKLTTASDHVRSLVAVYVSGPGAVSALPSFGSAQRPVIVVAPLYKSLNPTMWLSAIRHTAATSSVDLAVAPRTDVAAASVGLFGLLLAAANPHVAKGIAPPDLGPPSAPDVRVDAVSPSSVTVSWPASTSNVGIASYGLYVNGVLSQAIAPSPATVLNLICGVSYTVGVDAIDTAGRHSPLTSITAKPGPCSSSGSGSSAGGSSGGSSGVGVRQRWWWRCHEYSAWRRDAALAAGWACCSFVDSD